MLAQRWQQTVAAENKYTCDTRLESQTKNENIVVLTHTRTHIRGHAMRGKEMNYVKCVGNYFRRFELKCVQA